MGKRIEVIMRTARVSVSFAHAEDTNITRNIHINSSTYFQQYYQAEHTITQYKGYSGVDTKLYPKKWINYPYEKIINFASNLPYSFRCCFVCENIIATAGPNACKEHGE